MRSGMWLSLPALSPMASPSPGAAESLGARGDECMHLHFYVIDISEYRHSPTCSHSAHYLTVFLRYFWFQSLKSCCVSVNSCLVPPVWMPQGPSSQSLCGRCFHSLQGCSSLLGAAVLGHHYGSGKPPPPTRGGPLGQPDCLGGVWEAPFFL